MSSHEANPTFYDPVDWQLTKTAHSYESSKFQVDLIAHQLDQISLREGSAELPIRHLIVLPGVAGTNITSALLGTLATIGMFLSFYIVSHALTQLFHPLTTLSGPFSWISIPPHQHIQGIYLCGTSLLGATGFPPHSWRLGSR